MILPLKCVSCGSGHKEPACTQGISQDLESGWPKSTIVRFWGLLFFKEATIYLDYNHKHYHMLEIDTLRNY